MQAQVQMMNQQVRLPRALPQRQAPARARLVAHAPSWDCASCSFNADGLTLPPALPLPFALSDCFTASRPDGSRRMAMLEDPQMAANLKWQPP